MRKASYPVSILFSMAAASLLTSCGTCFHEIPYNVGVRCPFVEGKHIPRVDSSMLQNDDDQLQNHRLADRRQKCNIAKQELYRIGADYYVKTEVIFTPVTKSTYKWSILRNRADFPVDDAKRQQKETFYFCVPDFWSQDAKWLASEHCGWRLLFD